MLIKAFNIEWCTDGEEVDLPNEAFFEVDEDFDPVEDLADLLSDHYGWAVNYCEYDTINNTKN